MSDEPQFDADLDDIVFYDHEPADHGRPPRWVPAVLVGAVVALIVANYAGRTLLASSLLEGSNGAGGTLRHPVRILALNSTNMNLLATGFQVDWIWFMTVPMLRLLAPDPLFYLLGYLYRHKAREFVATLFPGTEKFFELADADADHRGSTKFVLETLVVLAPNNPICAIAGIMAMPVRRFVLLNVIGTIGRLILFKLISTQFQSQIGGIINWLQDYQSYLMYGALALLVVNLAVSGRKVLAASKSL